MRMRKSCTAAWKAARSLNQEGESLRGGSAAPVWRLLQGLPLQLK